MVEHFFRAPELRDSIEECLMQIGDLERIASKVAVGRVNPREMVQLMLSLKAIEPIKNMCMQTESESLRGIGERLDACVSLRERIEKEMNPSPPILSTHFMYSLSTTPLVPGTVVLFSSWR